MVIITLLPIHTFRLRSAGSYSIQNMPIDDLGSLAKRVSYGSDTVAKGAIAVTQQCA